MIPKLRPSFLKILLFAPVFFAVLISGLRAEVTISRTRLGGRSPAISRNSWCEFQCLVENTDDTAHDVLVRLRSADTAVQTNYYAGSLRIPANTTTYLRFPVVADGSKKYQADLFCDGKKRPTGEMNSMLVNVYGNMHRRCFILNDRAEETPGFLFDSKNKKKKKEEYRPSILSAENAPDTSLCYQDSIALLIVDPDFSRYSSAQIQAILAYVAEGGTLVFTDPKGALAAAGTPLADLLPVTPLRTIRAGKIPLADLLHVQADLPEGKEFLASIPGERGVVSATYDGMPLFAEKQYGLGTVRLLAVAPVSADLRGKDAAVQALFRRLIVRQDLYPNRVLFEEKLDQLTGFDIPDISEIAGLAAAYLAIFFVILLTGILFRRPGAAWFASVALAVGMIALILCKASRSFEHRSSVLAEVTLKNARPVRSGETYGSCFVNTGSTVRLGTPDATDVHFSTILRDPRISYYSKAFFNQSTVRSRQTQTSAKKKPGKPEEKREVRIAAPLDIVRSNRGQESIPGMTLAPRTSREFMGRFFQPATESVSVRPDEEPEVVLSDKGLDMAPYQIPGDLMKGGKISAWLILPGGVRSVSINGSGVCRLSGGNGLLVDEAAHSMADVLCRGLRKPGPYLAFIRDAKRSFLSTNVEVMPQGKQIVLIPARLTVASRTVRIPRELLTFSPQDVSSRFVVNGNDFMKGIPILTGFSGGIRISLPSQIASILKPEKLSLFLDCRLAESVGMDLAVAMPGGDKPLEKTGRSEYRFTDFPETFRPDQAASVLILLKTRHKTSPSKLSPEQVMQANSWYLRSAEAEVLGRLDDSISLPARF